MQFLTYNRYLLLFEAMTPLLCITLGNAVKPAAHNDHDNAMPAVAVHIMDYWVDPDGGGLGLVRRSGVVPQLQ